MFSGCDRINEVARRRVRKGIGRGGDILFTHRATVGRMARVAPEAPEFVANPGVTVWRVLDRNVLDPNYLYYAMQSKFFMDQVWAEAGNTDTFPYISLTQQRGLRAVVPDVKVQCEVGAVLGALDDRIALLRETNATLEAIAQALFKSWFVDFDPVRAKQQGLVPVGMDEATAALFPGALEQTDQGDVPEGWQTVSLGELVSRHRGSIQTGPFGSQLHAADYVPEGVPVVMPKDISNRRATTGSIARVRAEDAQRLARHQLQPGDIVFSRRGDVERHALITGREVGWLCGTGCLLVRPAAWQSPGFLSMLLDAPRARTWLVQHAVGATMPNLNTGILASVPVVLPPQALLAAFESLVAVTEEQRSRNATMAETLAALRDNLLPRLISGQLRLPEAEALAT